ncbi:MAG: SDR family oxidoreductase [Candidatus Latescibacterota bacterium]|jgi:NADP-dependent 3-hydroxy acid dehydrogenase YdfG
MSKTTIITGAGTGIGQGIAIAFANAGYQLVLAGRRIEPLEETAKNCGGTNIQIVATDVTDRNAVQLLAQKTIDTFGSIDVLINNAGINTQKRNLDDISDEDWDRVININLTGAFNAFRAVRSQMKKQKDGVVINIASMAGKKAGTLGGAAYSASKFGMASLTQSINAEFRDSGIRACCIYPGEVDTPILDHRPIPVSAEKRAAALLPEDVAAAALMVAQLHNRAIVEELTIFPRRVVSK